MTVSRRDIKLRTTLRSISGVKFSRTRLGHIHRHARFAAHGVQLPCALNEHFRTEGIERLIAGVVVDDPAYHI